MGYTKTTERSGERRIKTNAKALNMAPEDYVELVVQSKNGIAFHAAVEIGVYPTVIQYWLRKAQEKRLRTYLDKLLPGTNPRWVVTQMKFTKKDSPNSDLKAVLLQVQVDEEVIFNTPGHWVEGDTPELVVRNAVDFAVNTDPEAWLDDDPTIPMEN